MQKQESKQWDGEHRFQVMGTWWGGGPGGQDGERGTTHIVRQRSLLRTQLLFGVEGSWVLIILSNIK